MYFGAEFRARSLTKPGCRVSYSHSHVWLRLPRLSYSQKRPRGNILTTANRYSPEHLLSHAFEHHPLVNGKYTEALTCLYRYDMGNQDYSRGKSFWHTYLKGRPQVPDSFFERLYRYHEANGGNFDDINDVGAGLGNLSVRLAEKFCRVVVTEPSERTLEDAELFIRETAEDVSQFSFVHAAAEDDVLAPASVDAVFVCNALHWIDCERALPILAKQLNCGGTLFAALFGIPVLTNPDAQAIWQKLFDITVPFFIKSLGKDAWRTMAQKNDSGYDAIAIPDEYFEPGVIRLRLNASEDMHEFCSSATASSTIEPISKIEEEDEVQHVKDDSLFFEASLDNLKDIFNASSKESIRKETEELWENMQSILGARKVTMFYPVSIIMATRR